MTIIKLLIVKIKNNHTEIYRFSSENKHNVIIINFITLYSWCSVIFTGTIQAASVSHKCTPSI